MARLVYGLHPVEEALRAKRVSALFILEGDNGPGLKAVMAAARNAGVEPIPRTRVALDELAHRGAHQGAIAVGGDYPYATVDQILSEATRSGRPPLVLVLDGVQDPQNLGALIRSAHVVGAHGVVIPRDRAAEVTPTVVKTSAGATEHTRVAQVTNVARALEELKEAGLWIAGAVADGGEAPWQTSLDGPLALVLGAENKGIRPLVLRGCDLLVKIPMVGKVASLNVGAAGAVLLYEAARQRATAQAKKP
jgi:23S rRNA (guanosine2251-2'-O)-methyltransferase